MEGEKMGGYACEWLGPDLIIPYHQSFLEGIKSNW
jgi:hypothetical protein